jgi:hypothetical protein
LTARIESLAAKTVAPRAIVGSPVSKATITMAPITIV